MGNQFCFLKNQTSKLSPFSEQFVQAGNREISRDIPDQKIFPEVGGNNPAEIFTNVVFPAPEGPIKATFSPGGDRHRNST